MARTDDYDAAEPPAVVAYDQVVAVWKPHRMHCAALAEGGGASLAAWMAARFPETAPASFPPEAAAVDAGLVLFARNPRALSALRAAQEADGIRKTYRLQCCARGQGLPGSRPLRGAPEGMTEAGWAGSIADRWASAGAMRGATIRSRFRSYGPRGARVACLDPSAEARFPRRRGSPERDYVTSVPEAEVSGGMIVAAARLTRGFRHQIRAHFAWIGLPLLGDGLYGGEEAETLRLVATAIEFEHPGTGSPTLVEA